MMLNIRTNRCDSECRKGVSAYVENPSLHFLSTVTVALAMAIVSAVVRPVVVWRHRVTDAVRQAPSQNVPQKMSTALRPRVRLDT